MSDYDVEIARKIANVICGGDLTSPQKVSEKYLLEIEREGFMSLWKSKNSRSNSIFIDEQQTFKKLNNGSIYC